MRDISSPLDGFSSPFGPGRRTLTNLLFGQTEPGFTFEPWDITTLYQDRAGTTPVTAAGQSVGLRLDKSKGLALGAELVTNGDFSSDTAWSKEASWAISGGAANKTAGAAGSLYQASASMVQGRTYLITFTVSGVSAGTLTPFCRGTVGVGVTANGTYTQRIVAGSDGVYAINFYAGATFVGTIDNISVRELAGNHEVAINDAARGVYGWMPKTGRRNLLTYTEQFDNAAWAKIKGGLGTTPTVTSGFTDPDGGNAAWRLVANSGGSGVSDYSVMRQTLASTDGARSIYIKSNTGASQIIYFGAPLSGSALTVTTSWTRVTFNAVTASLFFDIGTFPSTAAGGSGTTADVLIWHPQLETGSTDTAYQRVASQYDITEAGVPTCYYVQADGVDDAYVTPTITPNTDKAQVFAGVRRLVDTAGVMIEHSADWNSNNGTFLFFGGTGGSGTGAGFSSSSRGSAVATGEQFSAASNVALTPPVSAVVTALHDIAAPLSTSRANGFGGTSTAAKGTGNFLAYPLYIYGRGGTSLPFNGLDFGHAVRFGPNLDAATIARVESLIARNTPEVTL